MRRLLVVSAVAIGTLAVSSTASASPQFKSSYKLKLTTGKPRRVVRLDREGRV